MFSTIDLQSEFASIIKRKAVGPRGSKHLNEDDLQVITSAMASDEVYIAGKAALVVSVIILERNKLEDELLVQWKSGEQFLPNELMASFFDDNSSVFQPFLNKILNNEDLSTDEASAGVGYLLSSKIPDYQKSIFLIGERLKRETVEENGAFLQAMQESISTVSVNVPLLIEFSDPYDGFIRYPIYTLFVVSVLAAMGFPVYCHGVRQAAPKNGVTVHQILDLAEKNFLKSPVDVAKDISNKEIGWGYIDQSVYSPALNSLINLREKIIKRPFLATLEKLLQPLRSTNKNFLVTGFVHEGYKTKLAKLLMDRSFADAAFIVKGMEGSTQIDFRKKFEAVVLRNGKILTKEIEKRRMNDSIKEWEDCRSLAEYTLETGLSALSGKKGAVRKILINQVVRITNGLQILEANEARLKAQETLESGKALRYWQNGCN